MRGGCSTKSSRWRRIRLEGNSPGLAPRDQSGWPRPSRLGASRHLGDLAYAATTSRTVQFSWFVQSVGDALVLCAGLTRFGRRGEAARCGQEDAGGTGAAFRAGGRQLAFRHRSQPCKRPALLAHIFVRRHRPPAPGLNASCGEPVRRDCEKLYQFSLAGHNDRPRDMIGFLAEASPNSSAYAKNLAAPRSTGFLAVAVTVRPAANRSPDSTATSELCRLPCVPLCAVCP
jgi:hypothetical protein